MKRMIALCTLIALPAAADVTSPSGKTVDCYCTDANRNRIELGETICLQVDGRMFMAQCQMSLNVPMWREVQEGCLSSALDGPLEPFQSGSIDAKIPASKS
ncbi:hypothetical protein [Sulfitobacter aestuariivivens]|uniref:Uncharacterized protein n=1 Tax=Sulfitobacter aestuariivivens TaxID=2766981 RepID=A0A927HEI3_9RHOB|nr:hypothetical protein [Sulfitobacter aestuariivivens]MBD3663399.1 hypothetical protein [Sulfitobacter aestuariivivens]